MTRWFDGAATRLRGSAGVKARARRLADHPVCAMCAAEGYVVATEQIDHVKPLALGGTDTDDNVQGLCRAHHEGKSISEGAGGEGAAAFPTWLGKSTIPVTIVCGPPGAGKREFVRQSAAPGDLVIDLGDMLATGVGLVDALRARNAMLGALNVNPGVPAAWFITGAPSHAERAWWQDKLGGKVVALVPPASVCEARLAAAGVDRAAQYVTRWFAQRTQPWRAPQERAPAKATGADGLGVGGEW